MIMTDEAIFGGSMMEMTEQYKSGVVLRNRIATALMILAILAALYAAVTAVGVALSTGPDTKQVEWWRAVGFMMFTGVFILLALNPRKYPGLWELTIVNKLLLTVIEVSLITENAANAQFSAMADGVLTVILVVAYVLSQGYRSWKR